MKEEESRGWAMRAYAAMAAGVAIICGLGVGCGGDAGMELAASDALVAVADQMQVAVQEYHRDVMRYDDSREDGVVAAFVTRVQATHDDAATTETNIKEFEAALRKLRDDRETEWQRRTAALSNVDTLREVAKGMQKLALESLSLRDEVRRYVETWIANRQRKTTGSETAVVKE